MTENPLCPTCRGIGKLFGDQYEPDGPCFEPHCVDGRLDDDWCRAIATAVMADEQYDYYDATYDATDAIRRLRAVRP